jgi:ABC-type branched-subunit amino acid transport system substrate-binding protein
MSTATTHTTSEPRTDRSDEKEATAGPARASLLSVFVAAATITVNHLFALGPKALLLGLGLTVVPALLLRRFTATRSRAALTGYLLINLWIVAGFGLYKGLWKGALRLFLGTLLSALSSEFPKPTVGSMTFEMSGLLMLVSTLFVLHYGVQFVRGEQNGTGRCAARMGRRGKTAAAVAALIGFGAIAGAFVVNDRDRWTPPPDGIVRIGIIVPTTGPYSILGNSFVKAVQMARDDLRGTKYRYELIIRDTDPDPAKARAVIEKVIREDRVAAVVGGISLIGQVTRPLVTQARTPHICVCTVGSIGDGVYSFTNIPSPEAEAVRWVQEAQRRGIRNIALLSQDYPSINSHVKALKIEAARAHLQIAYERRFDDSVGDFRAFISQAAAVRPDVYFVEALNPALDRLAGQLADAGVRNISSVVAPSLSEKPELFEGAWYTDSNLLDREFKLRFERKYPGTQFATHMMPYAYDSLNMIVQAFERGQNPAVHLRQMTSYDGTADKLTKSPGGGNFKSRPAVWVVKNSKPTLVD